MNVEQLRSTVNGMRSMIEAEMGKAENKKEEQVAEMFLVGLSLLGELLVDIKRIADATESGAGR